MTRQQKFVLIALAVLLLLFALVMLRGGMQKGDCLDRTKCSNEYLADQKKRDEKRQVKGEGPSLSARAGGLLAPLAPKLEWRNKSPQWREKRRFTLPGGTIQEPIEADADKPFRMGRMRLTSGPAASLLYVDTDSRGERKPALHKQSLDLSAGGEKAEGTFIATRNGGVLTIVCPIPCTVEAR